MSVEIITKDDLQLFRNQLLSDIRDLFSQTTKTSNEVEGYKTSHVRKILGCSVNKLTSLRVSRNIRTKKIGGTIYYNKDDVRKLLEEGF